MRRVYFLMIAIFTLTPALAGVTAAYDKLRSDLRSALSLAAETDLFIGQINRNRLLPQFRTSHAEYLRAEVQRRAKEARSSTIRTVNRMVSPWPLTPRMTPSGLAV